jgi:hypothetical protein
MDSFGEEVEPARRCQCCTTGHPLFGPCAQTGVMHRDESARYEVTRENEREEAMNQLLALSMMLALVPSEQVKEPTLEWTLMYMVREIPAGQKESDEDALDFRKHRKDFKEQSKITIYTTGFTASMAKVSTPKGQLTFSVVPRKLLDDHVVQIYGVFQQEGMRGPAVLSTKKRSKIKTHYGEEIELGGSAGGNQANTFILIVKRADADIPVLARQSIARPQTAGSPLHSNREELTPPKLIPPGKD